MLGAIAKWLRHYREIQSDPHAALMELCSRLSRERKSLSEQDRRFVAIMKNRLDSGLPLHANHAAILRELDLDLWLDTQL